MSELTLVPVSQVLSGTASGPASEILPEESVVVRELSRQTQIGACSACTAEKLDELGNHGFQRTPF